MKIANTKIPESFVNALEKRDPQASSSGERIWSNYFTTEMFSGKIPVVFRFRTGENPSSETTYDMVAHWIRGSRAGKDYSSRSTVDHWEIKFFAHPENDPEQEFYIVPFGHEQDVKFNGDFYPEKAIDPIRGTNKSGLIFFTPIGVEPDYEIVGVKSDTLFEEAALVQIPKESWRKVPGAYRTDVGDGDGDTIAVYDKRKGKERQRGVALAQKIRKNLKDKEKSYEYITLRDLKNVGEVNFALTENGIIPFSEK